MTSRDLEHFKHPTPIVAFFITLLSQIKLLTPPLKIVTLFMDDHLVIQSYLLTVLVFIPLLSFVQTRQVYIAGFLNHSSLSECSRVYSV